MTERAHEPKVAALLALEAGGLSATGELRIRRHLADCDACQSALAAMRQYDALLGEVREAPIPAVDFDKMALPIARALGELAEAPTPGTGDQTPLPSAEVPRRRGAALGLVVTGFALAAAAVLMLRGAGPGVVDGSPEAPRAAAPRTSQGTAPPEAHAVATLLGAGATIDGAPATLDTVISRGATLRTPPGVELHVRIGGGTGLWLEGATEAVLEELAVGRVRVRLLRGAITNQVAKLGDAGRYEVVYGEQVVRVHGTHFRVAAGAPVSVVLAEGVVELSGPELSAPQRLVAPAVWPLATAQPAAVTTPEAPVRAEAAAVDALRTPHLGASSAAEVTLGLPALPTVAAWHVGGTRAGTGALRMRVPPGSLTVGAELTDGRLVSAVFELGAQGVALDAKALGARLDLASPAVRPRRRVPPAELSRVIRGGRRAFQRCYELALKRDPRLRPQLKLRLGLDPAGRVVSARPVGQAPPELQRCVRNAARRLRFPAPGGDGLRFDAPLSFRQRL